MADGLSNVKGLTGKFEDMIKSISFLSEAIEDLKREVSTIKQVVKQQEQMKEEIRVVKDRNRQIEQRIDDIENYNRRCSATVGNLGERGEPDILTLVRHWDLLHALRTGQSTQDLHFKHESELHMSASAGKLLYLVYSRKIILCGRKRQTWESP